MRPVPLSRLRRLLLLLFDGGTEAVPTTNTGRLFVVPAQNRTYVVEPD